VQGDADRPAERVATVHPDQRVVGAQAEERVRAVVDDGVERRQAGAPELHEVADGRVRADAERREQPVEAAPARRRLRRVDLNVGRVLPREVLQVLGQRVGVERGVQVARAGHQVVILVRAGHGVVAIAGARAGGRRLELVAQLVEPAVGPLRAGPEAARRLPGRHDTPRPAQAGLRPALARLVGDRPQPPVAVHRDRIPHLLRRSRQVAVPGELHLAHRVSSVIVGSSYPSDRRARAKSTARARSSYDAG
jgi:hypothetical protein